MSNAERVDLGAQRAELENEIIRAHYEISPDGLLALTSEGEILSFNDRFLEIWGESRETVNTLDRAGLIDTLAPQLENSRELRAELEEIRQAPLASAVVELQLRDGRRLELRSSPATLGGGAVHARLCFFRDVTDQAVAQAALRETENRFRQLADNIDAVFWLTDVRTGRLIYVSRGFERIWGFDPQRLMENPDEWWNHLHPDDIERVEQSIERHSAGDSTLEYRIVCPDGSVRWLRDRAFAVRNESGEIYRMAGVAEDVTEAREGLLALAEAEERYRRIVATAPQAIFALDEQGRFTELNAAGEALLGAAPGEMLGESFTDIMDPEDRILAVEEFRKLLRGETTVSDVDLRITRRDGERRMIHSTVAPVSVGDRVVGTHGVAWDTTEERAAAEALRVTHAQLGHILATSPTVLYTLRVLPDGSVRDPWVSNNIVSILGYRRSAVLDPSWWSSGLHPADRESALGFTGPLRELGHFSHEYRFRDHQGLYRWLHDSLHVVARNDDGSIEVVGSWTDVSAQKRSDTMVRESERSYRSLFDNLSELVLIIGPDRLLLSVNDATLRRTGLPWSSFLGVELSEVLAEGVDAGEVREAIERAAHGDPQRMETWARTAEGQRFPLDMTLTRGHYFGADVVVVVGRDVTDARRAREMLAAAETHYRRLVDASPYGIFAIDRRGRFIEVNRAAASVIGRPASELLGESYVPLLEESDLQPARDAFQRWIEGEGVDDDVEVRLVHPSGERRLVQLRGAPIMDGGEAVGVHGVARDITEERRRDEAARLSAAALEGLEEGVAIFDRSGEVVYHNAAHARILGYEPADPPNILTFAPDDEARREFRVILDQSIQTGSWSGRVRRRRVDDGRIIPLQVILGRMERADGTTLIISIIRDISEELAAERRLRRAERLASVGTLIGGVAHELNNPLHAIRNFAELLLDAPRDAEEQEDLETIRREADRAAQIVADLRLLAWQSQAEEGTKKPVDLNDVAEHVLKVRSYSLSTNNVETQRDFAEALPPIQGDRGQLEQVVLNLVVNAEQAMAGRQGEKRLTIRTRASDRGASLTVIDTGTGIEPADMDRLFDPFWTTKPPGEGTGLGLPLVHGIVTEHRGEIHVESEPGKGTSFRIDLPASPTGDAVGPTVRTASGTAFRPLRVLVVEDEAALRRSLERYLKRRGHEVTCASEGAEALRLLEGEQGFDVILSDLRMPGMSGEALVNRLRDDPRGLHRRLILMTGDAASPEAVKVLSSAGVPVLVKPVPLPTLSRAVEQRAAAADALSDGGSEVRSS